MRIIAAGLSLLAVLALAACGAAGTDTPATTITNRSASGGAALRSSPTATVTVTRTVSPTSAPPAGQSAATGACTATDLALSFLGQQGATGHGELGFSLRNTARATCTTIGYPGIQFLAGGGTPLPTTPTHTTADLFGHTSLHAVTLRPGQSASFRLGVTHGAGSSAGCTTAAALRVIAPNDTATLRAAIPNGAAECGTATVSPLTSGDSAYP